MKIAIFTVPVHPPTKKLLRYFNQQSMPIEAVIIEKGYRKKLSEPEKQFRDAHDRFNLQKKKYPLYRRILKKIWDRLPVSIKQRVWKNATKFPFIRNQSIEYFCTENNIPLYKVEKHSSMQCREIIEENDIDYVVMSSSNWLIKDPLLSMAKTKIINAHPGYLPKHRGLDSLSWSIRNGDPTGLTTYMVDEGIDTGPVLKFYPVQSEKKEGLLDLIKKIEQKKPQVIYDTLKELEEKIIKPQNQPEGEKPHRPMTYEELVETDRLLIEKTKG
jgi:folate-dependent phosphoribosylglycinamide formyltransferase PurN